MTEKNPKLFDLRVVERNIEKGLITRDEYQAHLDGLADSQDNAAAIEAKFEAGIFEDDEGEDE